MAEITSELVQQLHEICKLPPDTCHAALAAHDGDLDGAMQALAAMGVLRIEAAPEKLIFEYPRAYELTIQRKMLVDHKRTHPEIRRKFLKISDEKIQQARAELKRALKTLDAGPDLNLDPAPPSHIAPDVQRLNDMCSAGLDACQAALDAHHGEIDAALQDLIRSGSVTTNGLHPELVTDEHYALTDVRETLTHLLSLSPSEQKMFGPTVRELRQQLSGKTPFSPRVLALAAEHRADRINALHSRKPKRKPIQQRMVTIAPFPKLKLCAGDWEGTDLLPSWKGFESRGGAYGSRSSSRPSTGKVKVRVIAVRDRTGDLPPSPEQLAAYQYLKDNEPAITASLLAAILRIYPKLRKNYGFKDSDYMDDLYMPVIKTADDLRPLIGLGTVHVLDIAKADHAYIGFECGCTWDEEHGLGVLMDKGRVIEVGQADMAFDQWAAKKDGGKAIKPAKKSEPAPSRGRARRNGAT